MKELTHIDKEGRARMVDVGAKPESKRTARAAGSIKLSAHTVGLIKNSAMKKGDVLTVAEIAGVQAAKRTSELVPLSHNIMLNKVTVTASLDDSGVKVDCEAVCRARTGVEMEALTAVSVALLTVYDMCKAVDKEMTINNICLLEKIKEE